jgi:hypothetical protein
MLKVRNFVCFKQRIRTALARQENSPYKQAFFLEKLIL